jgi:hypothetical protein
MAELINFAFSKLIFSSLEWASNDILEVSNEEELGAGVGVKLPR